MSGMRGVARSAEPAEAVGSSTQPTALQIIELDTGSGSVHVVKENLEIVSDHLRAADCDAVCMFSIVGGYRTGKSFILNLMMRFLKWKMEAKHSAMDAIPDWRYGVRSHFGPSHWP